MHVLNGFLSKAKQIQKPKSCIVSIERMRGSAWQWWGSSCDHQAESVSDWSAAAGGAAVRRSLLSRPAQLMESGSAEQWEVELLAVLDSLVRPSPPLGPETEESHFQNTGNSWFEANI